MSTRPAAPRAPADRTPARPGARGRRACPACGRPLPPLDSFQAALGKHLPAVTCACGARVREAWQGYLASHAAALLACAGVVLAADAPRWPTFALGLAAWLAVHAALLPLRPLRLAPPDR